MTRFILAAAVAAATAGAAAAQGSNYPGITQYDYWRGEACGNGGDDDSPCERLFRRLCGRTPNAACVKRHQGEFARAPKFNR